MGNELIILVLVCLCDGETQDERYEALGEEDIMKL